MNTKAEHYLARARYCEDMAVMTGGHRVSATFADLARQWRELARQRRDFEKKPARLGLVPPAGRH
jgi:hypothetical protein